MNTSSLTSQLGAGTPVNVRASEGAGTTTLTVDDARHQIFNLSAARTCVLPTTGIKKGDRYLIENIGTFDLSFQASDATSLSASSSGTIGKIRKGFAILVALQETPTTNTHWRISEATSEANYVVDWTPRGGTGDGTLNKGVYIRRLNNQIFLTMECFSSGANHTAAGGSSHIQSSPNSVAFPDWAMPAVVTVLPINLYIGGAAAANSAMGTMQVNTNGLLELYQFNEGASFGANVSYGIADRVGNWQGLPPYLVAT